MTVSAEMEDYLETIADLAAKHGAARVTDIAKQLRVKKPSVTQALKALKEKGLLKYEPYTAPVLTVRGKEIAERVRERHDIMQSFLTKVLLIDPELAETNACRLEHAVDKEVLQQLTHFMDFVRRCPRSGVQWIHGFEHYCDADDDGEKCERCIQLTLDEFRAHRHQNRTENSLDENTNIMEQNTMSLTDLKVGETALIEKVAQVGNIRKRLLDMGAVRGTAVTLLKVAPLGDPLEVKIKGYNLTLRKHEAKAILLQENSATS
jgi:DtxR family Mn-dependent transcriptional regulator